VPDGRRINHARAAAVIITSLTTVGLGLVTASPAAAAPDDLDSAQARVDRLSQQADAAAARHDDAQASLAKQRDRLKSLTTGILRERRLVERLQTQMASSIVDQYDGSAGTSVLPKALPEDSEVLLTNVTVVSEDTDGRAEAMAAAGARIQQLARKRADVRDRVTAQAAVEKNLRNQEQKVDARAASAESVLAELEEKRIAEMGGPAVAYAKAQVGKSYVWGAAGPDSFDCSGLTMAAWQQAGVSLPHNSGAQYAAGQKISESELRPGDLVFYYSPISHVGIYIGDGQVVNALNPGSGVQISGLHDMPYSGAVRVG
jgi:cell wall-associated NlpC family hydrolase